MGVNWSMEVISWAVEWKLKTVPKEAFIVTDFCNALYGVFIFFIFVCNKEKQKKIQKWYVISFEKQYVLVIDLLYQVLFVYWKADAGAVDGFQQYIESYSNYSYRFREKCH